FCFGVCMMLVQLSISLGLIHVSGPFFGLVFKNSLYSGVFSMLSSLIIVPLVSFFTQKSRPAKVEDMFACYDTTVTVQAKNVLADNEDK
nr:sodium:solute symporter [Treponema sp.]